MSGAFNCSTYMEGTETQFFWNSWTKQVGVLLFSQMNIKKKILQCIKNPTAVVQVTAEAWVQSPAHCGGLKDPVLR